MKKYIKSVALLFLLFCSFTITEVEISEGVKLKWQNIYKVENLSKVLYKNTYGYKLDENEYKNDKDTDLILHFNNAYRENINIIGNYSLADISYIPNFKEKKLGEASANFSLQHHKIALTPQKGSVFYSDSSLDSYTIDFWVYPQSLYEGNTIFSFYGPTYIKEYDKIDYSGIKLLYTTNSVVLQFANIYRIGNQPITFDVKTNLDLEIGKWQHVAITYNKTTGKLTILKNGNKRRIVWLTDTSNENGTLLNPYISKYIKHNLVIGESFFGNIDEFHISKKFKEKYDSRKYVDLKGVVLSKVIDMEYYGSIFKDFKIKGNKSNKTELIGFVRSSETIFNSDTDDIEWIEISKAGNLKGRYIQWKIFLLDSYSGQYSPVLYDFIYNYIPNYPPTKPEGIRYKLVDDGKVKIEWKKNVETDIKGYLVYYGPKSHYYISEDAKEGISPIFTKNNYIYLSLPKYEEYFVSVKAVDNSYGSQKSAFSKEILVRSK